MSFNFTSLPSSLKFKIEPPALTDSENSSDDVMVRTKPESAHHQIDLKDVEALIPPLDFMVRTGPNIEHHEVTKTPKNNERKT
ncbi:hypothetical protein O181_001940 [Austropuccinia psidii MF-1]|uniref:Uncharacterized protein n=1 Tax=Austropuccinia psidii MF-1 TaxID=1389203 RepID=A0A9Q3BC33_9BASI|nr:hypothetical protein [Austropuccinia psidii MF-1]